MVLKVRETLIGQRVALINTVRGHAAEFGIIAAKGIGKIEPLFSAIEQEATIPPEAKEMFALLGRQIDDINARIKEVDAKLNIAHKANEVSQRLVTIPGVGPIIALTLAVEIDPAMFESGRHLAAWADLTPKERSTGGKQRMGGISRAGNERLRVLLVSGATSVINAALRPGSRQMTDWLRALLLRKPRKLAAMALANKMARMAWAMMKSGETYRRPVQRPGRSRHDRLIVRHVTIGSGTMPRPSIGETAHDRRRTPGTLSRRTSRRRTDHPHAPPGRPPQPDPAVERHIAAAVELQAEYAAWLDALPDNQQDSALAEALRAIVELDLSELQAIEPPRGFGRD